MGEKSAANLVASLERARSTTLQRFLIALGIPDVGAGVAELLATHFGDIEPLMSATPEELEAVDGVGPIIAEQVVHFFQDEEHRAEVAALRARGVRWEKTEPRAAGDAAGGPFEGRTFVLTGTLPSLSRAEKDAGPATRNRTGRPASAAQRRRSGSGSPGSRRSSMPSARASSISSRMAGISARVRR